VSLYRIKPMEWVRIDEQDCWECFLPIGVFSVYEFSDGKWDAAFSLAPADEPHWSIPFGELKGDPEAAKAAAEEWYRSRLLEALEPATEQDTRGTE
jgi:hypothetical protein